MYSFKFNIRLFKNIRNLREDHDKKQQELADYYNVSVDYLLGRSDKKG